MYQSQKISMNFSNLNNLRFHQRTSTTPITPLSSQNTGFDFRTNKPRNSLKNNLLTRLENSAKCGSCGH